MAVSSRWTIAWEGETYHEDELTIGQACQIEVDRGGSWMTLEPTKRMTDARAVLAVMASDRTSVDKNDIRAELGKMSATAFREGHLRLVPGEVEWRPEIPKPDEQWVIVFGEARYRKGDVTIDQAETIERLAGADWDRLHPLLWAQQGRVIAAVLHSDATDRTFEDVFAEVGAITAHDFVRDHVTWMVDDLPGSWSNGFPTEPTGERSTPSSSGSPARRSSGNRATRGRTPSAT